MFNFLRVLALLLTDKENIPNLTRAAVANGIDSLFMECHPKPSEGLSDPTTMYPLDQMRALLTQLKALDDVVKNGDYLGDNLSQSEKTIAAKKLLKVQQKRFQI